MILSQGFLPIQAQEITNKKPSPDLVKQIIAKISKDYSDINSDDKFPFSFAEIDLNSDKQKETIVLFKRGRLCNNRHCPVSIFNNDKNKQSSNLISEIFTSRHGLEIAVLPTKSYGWYDIAAYVFTYEPRDETWRVFRFNGQEYELTEKKLNSKPKNILLNEYSREFNLSDFQNK
ncbi:hypothetical protein [Anabaena cylindrica]|uniref:hypothetical protein n=1 Tax=Anabaena cylindrica TaxID=1165 RepID=UPI002B2012E0|nr:hypothetical protein [Anabaena cylindrica]